MIGLEYILEVYGIQQAELAERLGIRPQNLTLWFRRKQNVSKKYLPVLSEMFNMPEEYFQKELTDVDKRLIDLRYAEIKVENIAADYTDVVIDEEIGQEVEVLRTCYDSGAMYDRRMKEVEYREAKVLNKTRRIINDVPEPDTPEEYPELYGNNISIFERFLNIIDHKSGFEDIQFILSAMEKYENKENADKLLAAAESNISDALLEELSLSDVLTAVILLYEKKGIKDRVWGEKKPENLGN